jgi:hypothetical protein
MNARHGGFKKISANDLTLSVGPIRSGFGSNGSARPVGKKKASGLGWFDLRGGGGRQKGSAAKGKLPGQT